MKTNHRRKNPTKSGYDYSYLYAVKHSRFDGSHDYDGGHRGAARDIREAKTRMRRSDRRTNNQVIQRELEAMV
jgi:hypothetical protein